MMGSSSSEFIALCRSQVLLLTQALGAASTVVYLAEATAESINPALVPLVAYPETADLWSGLRAGLTAVSEAENGAKDTFQTSLQKAVAQRDVVQHDSGRHPSGDVDQGLSTRPPQSHRYLGEGGLSTPGQLESMAASPGSGVEGAYPLVLPLAYEGIMLGMMVSTRDLLPWTSEDYQQAEQVANTLAIACVLDQRGQWLQRQLNQRQLSQADQSENFHDLLHQFRNPLTALQTFGKLMVKRLPLEDSNRPIAEGIVRESRRLQDLAQHFDDAVALADETLTQSTTPSAARLLLPSSAAESAVERSDGPVEVYRKDSSGALAIAPTQGHGLGRSLAVNPGAIADVALPLVQSALPLAQERGLHLVHHIPTSLPDVWLDPAALGEVLHNLLDNALKYAPPGSLLWITAGLVQRLEGKVFQGIAVGDTGAGIPAADQPQLFIRHFRGVQAQGDIPGTGLGLAIVQDLVAGMGGHIDLISPVQGTPWLPPEAVAYPQNPGVLFVVWLQSLDAALETRD